MQKRRLGQTDLAVSALCLGTMTWGEQNDEAEAFAQMDRARAAGINFEKLIAPACPLTPPPRTVT